MIYVFNIGFLNFRLVDAIDILLVTFLLYKMYELLRGTVAVRIFIGILAVYLTYLVVDGLGMELLSTIFGQFIGVGVLAAFILFQQEIRKFLLIVGKTNPFDNKVMHKIFIKKNEQSNYAPQDIEEMLDAIKTLSATRTGALIVLPKSSELRFYVETGQLLDANLSKPLLLSIFNKESPLHDGGVIIYKGKVVASSCILPVTDKDDLPQHYGLRHRAAVGMTEETDASVIIVSEETGLMSFCMNGEMEYNLSIHDLRKNLQGHFLAN